MPLTSKEKYLKRPVLYFRWANMHQRCTNENSPSYKYYGARGIKVCKRWNNYENFIIDMYPSFKAGLSIDRIDNDGDYSPENCRWTDRSQQVKNSRKVLDSTKISYMGITDTISNWAKYLKIKRRTLGMRIMNYGWSVERALTEGGPIAN